MHQNQNTTDRPHLVGQLDQLHILVTAPNLYGDKFNYTIELVGPNGCALATTKGRIKDDYDSDACYFEIDKEIQNHSPELNDAELLNQIKNLTRSLDFCDFVNRTDKNKKVELYKAEPTGVAPAYFLCSETPALVANIAMQTARDIEGFDESKCDITVQALKYQTGKWWDADKPKYQYSSAPNTNGWHSLNYNGDLVPSNAHQLIAAWNAQHHRNSDVFNISIWAKSSFGINVTKQEYEQWAKDFNGTEIEQDKLKTTLFSSNYHNFEIVNQDPDQDASAPDLSPSISPN